MKKREWMNVKTYKNGGYPVAHENNVLFHDQ